MPIASLQEQVHQAIQTQLAQAMPDDDLLLDVSVGLRPAVCPDCEAVHQVAMVDVIISLDCCEVHRLSDITFIDYDNVADCVDDFVTLLIQDAVNTLNLQRMEAHEGDTAAEPDAMASVPPKERPEA